jgi:hypothetical protein
MINQDFFLETLDNGLCKFLSPGHVSGVSDILLLWHA